MWNNVTAVSPQPVNWGTSREALHSGNASCGGGGGVFPTTVTGEKEGHAGQLLVAASCLP